MDKKLSFIMILVLIVAMLSMGCSQQTEEVDKPSEKAEIKQGKAEDAKPAGSENAGAEKSEEGESTRTVISPKGKEVVLPTADKLNRVVMTAVPLPSTYRLLEDDLSKLVGINPGCKDDARKSILGKMAPEILDISDSFINGPEVNIEELLKLKPQVVFYYGGPSDIGKMYGEVGIPAVDISPKVRGNSLEMMMMWVEVLADVFELEEDIDEILSYGKEIVSEIQEKTSKLENDKKTKVLCLFRLNEKGIRVSGKGTQGDSWIQLTGAVNVAADMQGVVNADMEQIYKMNPERIYIFNDAMPEDLFNNTIKGQDWSKIKAVEDGEVYKIPVGIARWFPPSGDTPLMLKWMAQKNYPALFNNYKMEEEVKNYYNKYYKYDITDEDIHRILNPIREKASVRGNPKNY